VPYTVLWNDKEICLCPAHVNHQTFIWQVIYPEDVWSFAWTDAGNLSFSQFILVVHRKRGYGYKKCTMTSIHPIILYYIHLHSQSIVNRHLTTYCCYYRGVGSCSELGGHYKPSGHICMEKNYIPMEWQSKLGGHQPPLPPASYAYVLEHDY